MIRCFIALEPDDAARADLRHAAAELDMTGWRQTPAGKYHITLKFLGDVDANELDAVSDAIRRACADAGPISLRGTRVAMIPNDRRPRVLAAMFEATPRITELVERLEVMLADAGFAMEGRAYHPHVTLARKRRGSAGGRAKVRDVRLDHITIEADRIALIQSILTNDGPIYEVMARFALEAKA
ncbi:MAG: RNA 2',3'-cyclic phosphodiesterase [Phycisphaeraceae bacterium]